ncbi:pfkB-like carbohydrate kinase family protein [Zea mays]|uniref:PfkB-like carbohydrate kinase family protein n=1 Tax=Zea mays TaxID=4577 RepID=A0A1D6FCK2_MAIZE|nr:pfkB-like carbohydrate kinase family protein [Zea mays]
MGAEAAHPQQQPPSSVRPCREAAAPAVLGLQLSALIDHVARVDWSLLDRVPGDRGGSQQDESLAIMSCGCLFEPLRFLVIKSSVAFTEKGPACWLACSALHTSGKVSIVELNHILNEVNTHILPSHNDLTPITTIAGGSVANTIRGLSAGFGISTGIIGACGDDNQGLLFVNNMSFSGVDLTRLRAKKGHTAQCVCLVDASGNRTMRPCLSSAVKIQANEFRKEDFKGSKWLIVRYAQQNMEQIIEAIRIAKQEGLSVSLDLASFEMVRDSRSKLINLLETGNIDLCFANEDEAREVIGGGLESDPEEALAFLGKYCKWAVVTLASKGCMAKHGKQVVQVPAIGESNAVDTTGAGDLFASGFLYGLVKGLPLEECCMVGACSGGSVTRALGGEVRPENWQWMYKQMHARGMLLPELKN